MPLMVRPAWLVPACARADLRRAVADAVHAQDHPPVAPAELGGADRRTGSAPSGLPASRERGALTHQSSRDGDDAVSLAPQAVLFQRVQRRPCCLGDVGRGDRVARYPAGGEVDDGVVEADPAGFIAADVVDRGGEIQRPPVSRPVSSSSSRRAACSVVSPTSCAPPGSVQAPTFGGLPRRTSRTVSPLITTIPIPTIGRVGYSRSLTAWRVQRGGCGGGALAAVGRGVDTAAAGFSGGGAFRSSSVGTSAFCFQAPS